MPTPKIIQDPTGQWVLTSQLSLMYLGNFQTLCPTFEKGKRKVKQKILGSGHNVPGNAVVILHT